MVSCFFLLLALIFLFKAKHAEAGMLSGLGEMMLVFLFLAIAAAIWLGHVL
jgi:hypothetical protein